ncbi:MAG: T9SS type A sorting domain-containing protein [Ignavibacteriae bacterium]|jgi:hypothetical protein|nr:T9SS type A sorting domain-containing protein [Ignavibacteriota bacterium]
MKAKIFTALLVVFSFYFSANAQVIFTENFAYTAGDSLGAHGWTGFSSFLNVLTVTSPGLTYTGYPLSGIGNAVTVRTSGQDAYKDCSEIDSIGSVYTALMVRVDSAKAIGDYFLALLPQTSTSFYSPRLFVKDTLSGVCFGISKSSINATIVPTWGTTVFSYGTTYLLVLKYKFLTGSTTDDQVSLFVLTAPALPLTEPATPYVGPITSTQTDATSIGRIALRQGSSSLASLAVVDGIRIAKLWSNIVSGVRTISTVADNFNLSQNYPNPFNPSTTINFSIPKDGFVALKVYNALGQEVSSLLSENLKSGVYSKVFSAVGINSGSYFYRLTFTGIDNTVMTDTKKFMIIK